MLAAKKLDAATAFRRFDRGKRGRITADQLERGLLKLGVDVDELALDSLMLAFKKDREGRFGVVEFCRHFRPTPPSRTGRGKGRRKNAAATTAGSVSQLPTWLQQPDTADAEKSVPAPGPEPVPETEPELDVGNQLLLETEPEEAATRSTPAPDITLEVLKAGEEQVGPATEQSDICKGSEWKSVAALSWERLCFELPSASYQRQPQGTPSLLLRMPLSALHEVWAALPASGGRERGRSRCRLASTCRALRQLCASRCAGLRALLFEGWQLWYLARCQQVLRDTASMCRA
jgi:hypothetical protein